MYNYRNRRLFVLAISVGLLTFTALNSYAQQGPFHVIHKEEPPKISDPMKWHRPPSSRSLVGGLWMTSSSMRSSLTLKNVVEVAPLTVKPKLYLSNGREYDLSPVTLDPAGSATIDINQALQEQWGISAWATLFGYVEVQYSWSWDALCATINNVDASASLSYSFILQPLGEKAKADDHSKAFSSKFADIKRLDGVWWKQEKNVEAFVALSNVTSRQAGVILDTLDGKGTTVKTRSLGIAPHETKFIELDELSVLPDSAGGVVVNFPDNPGAVVAAGGLEDKTVGYSAHIAFNPAINLGRTISVRSYAEVGLMVGDADPMMKFPADTVFTPYSVLRNLSDRTITVNPYVYWMERGQGKSSRGKPFDLAANASTSVDMKSFLSEVGLDSFSGEITISYDIEAAPGMVVLASGSVDRRDSYVFEVMPSRIAESMGRSISHWSVANGNDTMITVWNPSSEAEELALRLMFAGGHYSLPIHLDAGAMSTLNVSDVLKNPTPDAYGNVIPVSVLDGSAVIQGINSAEQHIYANVDAGIYNVKKATCIWTCIYCSGASDWWIVDDPFAMAYNQNHQQTFWVQMHGGSQLNETSASDWTSSNHGVATVSSGLVQGVAPGSVDITSYIDMDLYGQVCGAPPECPFDDGLQDSSGGGVTPVLVIQGPSSIFLGSDPQVATANTFLATTASPSGGSLSGTSSDSSDVLTSTTLAGLKAVSVKTTDQSATTGDRTLTFKYTVSGEDALQTKQVTARKFYSLTNSAPSNQCAGIGTDYTFLYTVNTNPGGVPVGSGDDLGGTAATEVLVPSPAPCGTVTGNGALDSNGQLTDHVAYCSNTNPLTCTGSATQTLSVGGYCTRKNTLTYTTSGVTVTSLGACP